MWVVMFIVLIIAFALIVGRESFIVSGAAGYAPLIGGVLLAKFCTDAAYAAVYKDARTGYKTEAKILQMLNCRCSKGKFVPIGPTTKLPEKLAFLAANSENNPDAWHLTLDGYNADLHIAYEYNGPYHYVQTTPLRSFNDAKKAMSDVRRDIDKETLLLENGVPLIRLHTGIDPLLYERYIMSRLEELGALAPQASDKWTRIAKIPEPENHKMDDIIALYDMIGNETAQKQWITDAARRRKFEGLTVTGK